MAYIRFIGGNGLIVPAETGVEIWRVLAGEKEPNDEQAEFCKRVDRVYLNWRKAPRSYLDANRTVLQGIASDPVRYKTTYPVSATTPYND